MLDAREPKDGAAIDATLIYLTFSASEGQDGVSIQAGLSDSATVSARDRPDRALMAAQGGILGVLGANEANDNATGSGGISDAALVNASEARDGMSAQGQLALLNYRVLHNGEWVTVKRYFIRQNGAWVEAKSMYQRAPDTGVLTKFFGT